MTNYHKKQLKHHDNVSMYNKVCHIDLKIFIKSLKSITLYTQIHQLSLTFFNLPKDNQNFPSILAQGYFKPNMTMPMSTGQD